MNTPGSPEAVKDGCTCSTELNRNGEGTLGMTSSGEFIEGLFCVSLYCPIHNEKKPIIPPIMVAPLKETFSNTILLFEMENRSFAFVFDHMDFNPSQIRESPLVAFSFLETDKAPRPRFLFDISNIKDGKNHGREDFGNYSSYNISGITYVKLLDIISELEPVNYKVKYGDVMDHEICNGKKHYRLNWRQKENEHTYTWQGITEIGDHDESCTEWVPISPFRKEVSLLLSALE